MLIPWIFFVNVYVCVCVYVAHHQKPTDTHTHDSLWSVFFLFLISLFDELNKCMEKEMSVCVCCVLFHWQEYSDFSSLYWSRIIKNSNLTTFICVIIIIIILFNVLSCTRSQILRIYYNTLLSSTDIWIHYYEWWWGGWTWKTKFMFCLFHSSIFFFFLHRSFMID